MEKFKAKFLTPDEVKKISDAVAEAERHTQGEVLPMIVSRSSAVGHLSAYASLIIFAGLLVVLLAWQPWWLTLWHGAPVALCLIISCLIGSFISRWPAVQRRLVPFDDQEAQVWQRAQSEWAQSKIQKTEHRTGILIFVSVMEHKAVVLADEGIAKHYSQETWQEVVQLLTQHFHRGEWVAGFEKAIQRCGEILKKHLPPNANNPNEMPDHLVIKD